MGAGGAVFQFGSLAIPTTTSADVTFVPGAAEISTNR
jgi:hypothetical protein